MVARGGGMNGSVETHDNRFAASEGVPVLVIGRLIGHPLSTVLYIKDRGIEKPRDLNGKLMGYTVAGMEDVLARAFVN